MRKISHNVYLQALGLYTLARNHAKKTDEFNTALHDLLDVSPYGHISDAIYEGSVDKDFDVALMLEDIEVEKN